MNLGLRHLALNVRDAQDTKTFYMDFFGMQLEWEPDPQNVYLTTQGQDNLAIHTVTDVPSPCTKQSLDHLGFVMSEPKDVDALYEKARVQNINILKDPKWHRDGAYSFYLQDPDGHVVQVIYHPPISGSAGKKSP